MRTNPRIYVTGTDTDVGKTRVVAALGVALRRTLPLTTPVTLVKAVQTGCDPLELGDAAQAADAARAQLDAACGAGLLHRELHRFRKASDGYSAALAEHRRPLTVTKLATELRSLKGALVVEGSGGAAVPINARETISDVAARLRLPAVIVVGLRLGCINHTVLTARYLSALGCRLLGVVLVERWEHAEASHKKDVMRILSKELQILTVIPYDPEGKELMAAARVLEEELCRRSLS